MCDHEELEKGKFLMYDIVSLLLEVCLYQGLSVVQTFNRNSSL